MGTRSRLYRARAKTQVGFLLIGIFLAGCRPAAYVAITGVERGQALVCDRGTEAILSTETIIPQVDLRLLVKQEPLKGWIPDIGPVPEGSLTILLRNAGVKPIVFGPSSLLLVGTWTMPQDIQGIPKDARQRPDDLGESGFTLAPGESREIHFRDLRVRPSFLVLAFSSGNQRSETVLRLMVGRKVEGFT